MRYDRFTRRARTVIGRAKQSAEQSCDGQIGTDHLLAGLLAESGSGGHDLLERLGVDVAALRRELEARSDRDSANGSASSGALTPAAARTVDGAVAEADRIQHEHVGTEHLLLGMVNERASVAGRLLAQFGVELDRARGEVAGTAALEPPAVSAPAPAALTDPASSSPSESKLAAMGLELQRLLIDIEQRVRELEIRKEEAMLRVEYHRAAELSDKLKSAQARRATVQNRLRDVLDELEQVRRELKHGED